MTVTKEQAQNHICIAEIVGVHGLRGMVKMKVFTDDAQSLLDYASLSTSDGTNTYTIAEIAAHGNIFLAKIKDVSDRTAAENIRGTKLYVARDMMPDIEDEDVFYNADLKGLIVTLPDGEAIGTVADIANFGAGDMLEIQPTKGSTFYVPFTDDNVPNIDIKNKKITIDPPHGLLDL